MKIPIIFNIQKFSVHDGPGIRTTIFFKGCPINCKWCHNPESQNYQAEYMDTKDGKRECIGRSYSIKELVKEVEKDQMFYDESGGGVTLSGGEVMTQDIEYIESLVKELHRKGISVVIDTCGVAPFKNFVKILPYVDLFLYDLKFLDSDLHKQYTGVANDLVLQNLKKLSEYKAKINLRLMLIDKLNSTEEAIAKLIAWLQSEAIHVESVNLLPYHEFGRDKYIRLQRSWDSSFAKPTDEQIEKLKAILENSNYSVKIGG